VSRESAGLKFKVDLEALIDPGDIPHALSPSQTSRASKVYRDQTAIQNEIISIPIFLFRGVPRVGSIHTYGI
jgi:hypothetical protein